MSGRQGLHPSPTSIARLTAQLRTLGVEPGGVLLVHTAFSRVRPLEGGPARTPCLGVGVVADTFWRQPGVLRSDSPHAFAARGPKADAITAPHPPDNPHCAVSPVGRVHDLDGQVLLLGVGHDANTSIHLAEALAGVRYRRKKHVTVMEAGRPKRIDYAEIDHCCQRFAFMDGWLDAAGRQTRGKIAQAEARLMRARHVVEAALKHLRAEETVFLHPPGVDHECDEARASLVALR